MIVLKLYHIIIIPVAVLIFMIEVGCTGCEPVEEPEPEPEIPAAALIYPHNSTQGNISRSPVCIWDGHLEEDIDDSFEFTLEIVRGYETDGRLFHTGTDTTIQFPDTLESETYYRWWVITEASGGKEAKSSTGYFTTGTGFNNPPAKIKYIYPPVNGTDIPVDVLFSWYSFDPDGDEITYDLWYRREQDSDSTHAAGLTTPEYGAALDEDTRYLWHVTPYDAHGGTLSSFNSIFSTVGEPEGVFADLTLTRRQTYVSELTRIDMIWARFDEGYAPQYAIMPLQPDAVSCGGYDLVWQDSRNRYYYENAYSLYFLVPGTGYTFSITGGGGVPSLTESIEFPRCAPIITSPVAFDFVSMDGFEVVWSGYDDFTDCDRQVSIAILDIAGDSTGIYVTTDNDGSYTFTAGELSVIDPSLIDLQIVLIVENMMNIDAPGYDPRSWIRARTLTVQTVYAQ